MALLGAAVLASAAPIGHALYKFRVVPFDDHAANIRSAASVIGSQLVDDRNEPMIHGPSLDLDADRTHAGVIDTLVLDEDLHLEDHVATIELGDDATLLEGVGRSRKIAYEVPFEGTLFLSVMADAGIDPFLQVEDQDDRILARDDDSGGGKHALVRLAVKGGESLVIHVAVKGAARARVRFKLFEAPETDATRSAVVVARRGFAEAQSSRQLGDLGKAREQIGRAIDALVATPGSRESALIEDQLWYLGHVAFDVAALDAARKAWQHARAFQEDSLPCDQLDLQKTRVNFARSLASLGDLRGARELEEKVLEVFSRTLSDEDPDLRTARQNLATTLQGLGELPRARALEERVLEICSRTLSPDQVDLQQARLNLAVTVNAQGDFQRARALEEEVLEVYTRTLPHDAPDLQAARTNLAITMRELGDLQGALELEKEVLEVYSRTLPDDHPDVQRARAELAMTIVALGDLQGARTLDRQVLDVLSRTLPDDHPELQLARSSLARCSGRWAISAAPARSSRRCWTCASAPCPATTTTCRSRGSTSARRSPRWAICRVPALWRRRCSRCARGRCPMTTPTCRRCGRTSP
jgi:hypothetical protein